MTTKAKKPVGRPGFKTPTCLFTTTLEVDCKKAFKLACDKKGVAMNAVMSDFIKGFVKQSLSDEELKILGLKVS